MQQGQPGQNRTARSATIQCDCLYFVTRPAIIKIIQVISSLIGFCCVEPLFSTGCGGCIEWFKIAAMSGLLLSGIFLVVYFLHIVEKFDNIPWLKIEFVSSVAWTIFNLSAAAKLAATLNSCYVCILLPGYLNVVATAAFGFLAMAAYACDAGFQLFRMMKGIPAQ